MIYNIIEDMFEEGGFDDPQKAFEDYKKILIEKFPQVIRRHIKIQLTNSARNNMITVEKPEEKLLAEYLMAEDTLFDIDIQTFHEFRLERRRLERLNR